ncbi:MAG: cytochrome c oxidase subunit I [Acidimicrobiia bacterium]
MATTEVRPDVAVGGVEVRRPYRASVLDWLTTTDHKKIAIMYFVTSIVFLCLGGTFAGMVRTQLAQADSAFMDGDTYNQIMTMHAIVMVFLFLMPMIAAIGNYVIPLQLGATDMAFPKVNALSFWMIPLGGILMLSGFFVKNGAANVGWYINPPLANSQFAPGNGVNVALAGLAIVGASTTLGSINFIVTILKMRAPGMTMMRMPLFCWNMFVTSLLAVFSLPVLTAGFAMLWIDRNLGANFFNAQAGGDPILYQHIFWFFGHPEVYILLVPIMGIVSEIIPVFSRKPIFGYKAFVFSTLSIGALGTMVWAHHMFTTGAINVSFFAATSLLIAVPTGVKMFGWTATMFRGKVRWSAAMLFAIGFLSQFLIGGITGVFLGSGSIDFSVHDTYYVVGHFHYVLVAAALFGVMAASYYWFPKMTGRRLNETTGKIQWIVMFVGTNMTFMAQQALGLKGMPRRIETYYVPAWNTLNLVSSIGAYLIGIGLLMWIINMLVSRRRGPLAGDDPWDANTLEWATTSPPPYYNFDALPPIRSERPLFDLKHPEVSRGDAEAAREREHAGGH